MPVSYSSWLGNLLLILLSTTTALAQRGDFDVYDKTFTLRGDAVHRLRLDVDAGEVTLKPSTAEKDVRIVAEYQRDRVDIETDLDERRHELEFDVDQHEWFEKKEDSHVRLWIYLPPDPRLEIEARIKAGEVDIELGGLSVVAFDLTTYAGEVRVDFSEPNRVEMSDLRINTKIGETTTRRLGNARFRHANIDGGIGELKLDFSGQMLSNAHGEIDLDIGETSLHLPDDLGVKMKVSKFLFLTQFDPPYGFEKSGGYYYNRAFKDFDQGFALVITPGLGELSFR